MTPDDPTIPPESPDDPTTPEDLDMPVAPAAETVTGRLPDPAPHSPSRPDLLDSREPVYRESRGYRLRLEPADLARLRELAGSRGKSDAELGETFFDGQAERLVESVAADVPSPAELRVVVDPYSRQSFLALHGKIVGILSF
ncbi:MAG: hypothetical protein ABI968_03145 [Acidobacteriota bacterium]